MNKKGIIGGSNWTIGSIIIILAIIGIIVWIITLIFPQ